MIRIFTDTSANLPEAIRQQFGIGVVPFSYSIEGKEIPADTPFDGKAFYEAMRNGANVKTSMVNMQTFLDEWEGPLQNGEDILYLSMSGGISGTFQAATCAVQELSERYPNRKIAAVDTLAASLGEGLQVIMIAEMARLGADFEALQSKARQLSRSIRQFFTVDDLKYLLRGGRVNRVSAAIGTVLKIKPVLKGNEEGKIVVCGKIRGRRQSLNELARLYDAQAADKSSRVAIAHADAPEAAEELLLLLRGNGLTGECLTEYYEPVTGAHVGPGTVALFFFGEE